MVQEYHEEVHTLNHSESKIKFVSINWYNFEGFSALDLILLDGAGIS